MLPLLNQTLFTRINNIFSKELTRFEEPIVCRIPCRSQNQCVIQHLRRSSANVSEPNDTDLWADDTCGLWSAFYSSDLLLVHSKCNYEHREDLVCVSHSVQTDLARRSKKILPLTVWTESICQRNTSTFDNFSCLGPKGYTGIY